MREAVEMAELGFYNGCIGVRYFQKTVISQAVTPADGSPTVSLITVSGRRSRLTCSVLLLTKGKLPRVLLRS